MLVDCLNFVGLSLNLFRLGFDSSLNLFCLLQYPIPMKKETQGSTDRFISSWLKSQPRDKVLDGYVVTLN